MTLTSDELDTGLIEHLAKKYIVEVSLDNGRIKYNMIDKKNALEQQHREDYRSRRDK